VTAKKKEQEKFNEYAINTDDAWEIDDRAMTLKMLDNDNNGDDTDHQSELLNISKEVLFSIIEFRIKLSHFFYFQAADELASKVIQQHKSKIQLNTITIDASAGNYFRLIKPNPIES
jgi:hypothetical protein